MSHRKTGRHAVLSCRVPAGWQPTHYGTHPPAISSVTWYARKLHLHEAVAVVRSFNTLRLQGNGDGQWLLLVLHARSANVYVARVCDRIEKGVRS